MADVDQSSAIEALFLADQLEHLQVPLAGTAAYSALRQRDRARREASSNLLASMSNPGPQDLYRVAWLFNHGDTAEDAHRAHQLATRAAALGENDAPWLAAASYDRWQMYAGAPQKFGTQIVPDGTGHRVWDTDPHTTDAERARFNVPPLAAQHARAKALSRTQPQPPMDQAPAWLKAAVLRWNKQDGA